MSEFRWETRPEAKIKLEVPVGWTEARPEPHILVVTSPDQQTSVELIFITGPESGVKLDDKYIETTLNSKLSNPQIMNPPVNFQQHGLFGFSVGGGGKRPDGGVSQFFAIALGDGKGYGVVAFGLAAHRGFVNEGQAISRLTSSIQPA